MPTPPPSPPHPPGRPLRAALAALVLLAALGGGCPPRGARPPRRSPPGDGAQSVLRVRIPTDVPRLPCLLQGHTWCDRILVDTVYEPLVRWDPAKEAFGGVLAVSWRVGEKGRLFQLTLRKDVRWHNGRPLTAKDVKHTLERIRTAPGERDHPAVQRLLTQLERVSFRTERDVELHFRKPFGPVLELLASIPIQPAPPSPGTGTTPAQEEEDRVVGTGPFRFVQWWPGEKVVLGRWAGYWGPPPALTRVEFLVVPSLDVVVERFRKGTLDLVLDLDTRRYRQLLGRLGKHAHPIALEPAGFTQLALNCRKAPWTDRRLRRALAMLLDRKLLVSGLAGPRPVLLDGPVWQHGPQRRAVLGTAPAQDPEAAVRLLQEAGYQRKAGRWQKGGAPLTLRVHTAQRSDGINRGLRALRDDLAKAGIAVEVEKRLWGELIMDLRHRRFGAVLLSTPLAGPWTDLADLLHSRGSARGGNHAGFSRPDVDQALERLQGETVPTRRLARERRLFQIIGREVPFLALHAPRSLGFSRRPLPNQRPTTNWFDLATLKPQ